MFLLWHQSTSANLEIAILKACIILIEDYFLSSIFLTNLIHANCNTAFTASYDFFYNLCCLNSYESILTEVFVISMLVNEECVSCTVDFRWDFVMHFIQVIHLCQISFRFWNVINWIFYHLIVHDFLSCHFILPTEINDFYSILTFFTC